MLEAPSISARFLVSVTSNALRSLLVFASGFLVARGLNPAGYGDFTFLLGSFVAVRSLLDMGSSSAFYTFIAKRRRDHVFYGAYFGWLAVQFLIPLLIVGIIMPDAVISGLWLGHARCTIVLACAASFMQQQVWQTINHIGEAARKTVRVQIMGLAAASIHLAMVYLLMQLGILTVSGVFWLIIAEYLAAAVWAFWFLRDRQTASKRDEAFSWREMLEEYWRYCKPLVLLSWVAFLYEFADRWMLQRFGGASQQGFYQIASQFSAISLLATSSILNIFWKEIAEAHERNDAPRLARLYRRVNRGLVMVGAIISAFLIPWMEQIVQLCLGPLYLPAVPALMIMFLFPIHQSMGQINGIMMLASGHTRAYMLLSLVFMAISLPVTYFIQAPASGGSMHGLGMGALGMAIKMVVINIVSVNVQAWVVARHRHWRYDWVYQFVGISALLAMGYAARQVAGLYYDVSGPLDIWKLVSPILVAAVFYALLVSGLLWLMPWLAGVNREEIRVALRKFTLFFKPVSEEQ